MSDETAKHDYRALCASEPLIPLHSQDWWLDATCGADAWDVVVVRRDNKIVASLPYYTIGVLGSRQIVLPSLTPIQGVFIKYPPNQKYDTRLGFEKKIMTELIESMPDFDYFAQCFNASVTNWLPFMWKGFTQTTHYTYAIDDLSDLEGLFGEFKSSVRGDIRKATSQVEVRRGGSIADLYRLIEKTWERQNLPVPFSLAFLTRVDDAMQKHSCSEIFLAIDEEGRHHSALLLVWDSQSAYTQLIGEDTELRGSAAGKLVIWEAIQYTAKELGLGRFDFLGSMVEGIEAVRRSFAAEQVPLFMIRCDRRSLARRILQTAVMRFRPDLLQPRRD